MFLRSLCVGVADGVWRTGINEVLDEEWDHGGNFDRRNGGGNNSNNGVEPLSYKDWKGVSMVVRKLGKSMWGDFSQCDQDWKPLAIEHSAFEKIWSAESTLRLGEEFLVACIWKLHHYGHALMDHVFPVFVLMDYFANRGFQEASFSNSRILTTYNISNPTAFVDGEITSDFLGWLAPTTPLVDLLKNAASINKSFVCFESMILGLKRSGVMENKDILKGAYQNFRDFILKKNLPQFYLLPKRSNLPCKVLLSHREIGKRGLINEQDVFNTVKSVVGLCEMVVADFSLYSIKEQVSLVADTTVFVALTGSGAHNMIWLPDGGISVSLIHPAQYHVNSPICASSITLNCQEVRTTFPPDAIVPEDILQRMNVDVLCDLDDLEKKLVAALRWRKIFVSQNDLLFFLR